MPEAIRVRRIRVDEAARLRMLRLRALADAPLAFGTTLAEEQVRPESMWHDRAAQGAAGESRITFFAERDGRAIGLATGVVSDEDPEDIDVVGVWVDPAARRQGTGAALVEAVVAWARERGAQRAALWVTETNIPAITLYVGLGFHATGEAEPLPHAPGLREIRMVRDLARPAAQDNGPVV